MTAPVAERDLTAARADVAKGLRRMADGLEAGADVPLPSVHWPLTFRVPGVVRGIEGLEAIARALGAEDWDSRTCEEEDGITWLQLRTYVGGVPVQITADADPRLDTPGGDA